MAISAPFRYVIRELFKLGALPKGGALLEIGEANWYASFDRDEMAGDIEQFVSSQERRELLHCRMTDIIAKQEMMGGFELVKVFYDIFFAPVEVQAIDFNGTPTAHRFDLNGEVQLNRRFEVVINHGTAEHIFNIGQVFKTIHDFTLPGGVMIHESPFTGWIDHGFYSLQPTLYFDLAEINQYVLRAMFIEDISGNSLRRIHGREDVFDLARSKLLPESSMLITVMQMGSDDCPFEIPIQGYYRKALPQRLMTAWNEMD